MDKRDRDDLDRHITADDLADAFIAKHDETQEVELSEQDRADLETLHETREIKRTFDAYVHDEGKGEPGDRETWVQGTSVFIDENGEEHEVDMRIDHGAGLGNSHLSFAVDVDGERFAREYIDVTVLTQEWLASVAGDWIAGRLVPKTGGEA